MLVQIGMQLLSMWDVYRHFWLPFGKLLTDMEREDVAIDRSELSRLACTAGSSEPQPLP